MYDTYDLGWEGGMMARCANTFNTICHGCRKMAVCYAIVGLPSVLSHRLCKHSGKLTSAVL